MEIVHWQEKQEDLLVAKLLASVPPDKRCMVIRGLTSALLTGNADTAMPQSAPQLAGA